MDINYAVIESDEIWWLSIVQVPVLRAACIQMYLYARTLVLIAPVLAAKQDRVLY